MTQFAEFGLPPPAAPRWRGGCAAMLVAFQIAKFKQ